MHTTTCRRSPITCRASVIVPSAPASPTVVIQAMREPFVGLLSMADRALADHAGKSLPQNRLHVVGGSTVGVMACGLPWQAAQCTP